MFAKLYGSDDHQVLVVIDQSDNGPVARVSTMPDGLGVCSMAINFLDSDKGWEKAEATFHKMDEKTARRHAAGICELALES